MLEIACGIILAVLFIVFLPYIIAGAVLLAGSAVALAVVAAVLAVALYLLEAAGVDWLLVRQFAGEAFKLLLFVWFVLIAVAFILSILVHLGVFNRFPLLKEKIFKFSDVVRLKTSQRRQPGTD